MARKKKLTKMQEVFVNLMVYQDLTQTDCAHRAGFKNPEVIASRMMNNPEYLHVQERIQQMKALQRKKYDINFENVARKLAVIRDAAAADGSYGPAVNAEIARAKLGGLMVDRKEVRFGKIDGMSREQLEQRLNELLEQNQVRVIEGEVVNLKEVSNQHQSQEDQDPG